MAADRATVGCVPYVNAMPLVHAFETDPDSAVDVLYDVPSRLPAMLETGAAEAILVSSFDALTTSGRRMAAGVCIGSDGPVRSVRLFSQTPWNRVRRLAMDAGSMTSSALAGILLDRLFGVRPECVAYEPDLATMLAGADAALLIGDAGMVADGAGLQVLDLGETWTEWTGLPFVWAAWIGTSSMGADLAETLAQAARRAESEPEAVVAWARQRSGWADSSVRDYLLNVMRYRLDARMLEGLARFRAELAEFGFSVVPFPEIVGAPAAAR